jgi:cyclic beta-1,2-glucan synthetase
LPLGRLLISAGGEPTLLSWSGSMFEYLMPLLVMPTYENTLLDQTCQAAVARQIEYGKQRGVPWGVSESGYNTVDVHLNYQYRAFGVPGLGLKRGLAEDLVIAPYASALALMVAPEAACLNLQRLAAAGFAGRFGFYEAIDYTPSRLPRGQGSAVVRSFMAHHQGMSFLALAYLLLDPADAAALRGRPAVPGDPPAASGADSQGASVLLERHQFRSPTSGQPPAVRIAPMRVFNNPNTPLPEVQLLSNGRYHVMVTNAGGGYSRWKDLAVTRWREDATCDPWGAFCYLRDVTSGAFWSTAYQPTLQCRTTTRRFFPRAAPSFAAATTRSSPTPRSWSRRKTTSNYAGSASATAPAPAGSSKSPVTPKWFSLHPPLTRCIRRSATCLCKPSFSTRNRRSSAPAARARGMRPRPGCFT